MENGSKPGIGFQMSQSVLAELPDVTNITLGVWRNKCERQLMVPSVGSLLQDAWAVPTVGPQERSVPYPCLPVYHAESGRESGMDTHTCPPATQDARGGRLCLSLFSGMMK